MENQPDSGFSNQSDDLQVPVEPLPPQDEQQPARRERRHRTKMLIFGIAGAVALLAVGAAIFWFVSRADKQPAAQQTATQTSEQQAEAAAPTPADSTPVTYKSEELNIELTHRKDWTLKAAGDGALTVTSPRVSYASADGTSKTGVFTLRIRKGVTETMQATIDKSVAARDSEVIAYAAPAEGQREYTNLSYAGPKDMFGFFIVTSNTEFKAGAPLMYSLQFSDSSYLIAGGYGSDSGNSLNFDSVPKDSMDSTTLTQAIDIVESLKIY